MDGILVGLGTHYCGEEVIGIAPKRQAADWRVSCGCDSPSVCQHARKHAFVEVRFHGVFQDDMHHGAQQLSVTWPGTS